MRFHRGDAFALTAPGAELAGPWQRPVRRARVHVLFHDREQVDVQGAGRMSRTGSRAGTPRGGSHITPRATAGPNGTSSATTSARTAGSTCLRWR
ncbi:hypothetical protein SCALM49S_08804 [Streptomyces californicus]